MLHKSDTLPSFLLLDTPAYLWGQGGTVSTEQVQEIVEAVKAGRIDGGDLRRLSPFAGELLHALACGKRGE